MAKKPKLGQRICPKCKEIIQVDASICKHCGTEFSPEEVEAAKKASTKNTRYAAIGCLGLVFLIGCCTLVVSGGDPEADVPEKPTADAKADAAAYYRGVMSALRSCDAASTQVAEVAKSGDLVSLYSAANAMENACLDTPSDIRDLDVPASVGKASYKKLRETSEICENVYTRKWSAARSMKAALDGDGKVSAMAELKDTANLIQAGTMACAAGLMGEMMTLGVPDSDLQS